MPLIDLLLNRLSKINSLFFSHGISLESNIDRFIPRQKEFNNFTAAVEHFIQVKKNMSLETFETFEIAFFLEEFKHNGLNTFDLDYAIIFEFNELSYSIEIHHNRYIKKQIEKPYHEFITNSDLENFANTLSDIIIEDIEQKSQTK